MGHKPLKQVGKKKKKNRKVKILGLLNQIASNCYLGTKHFGPKTQEKKRPRLGYMNVIMQTTQILKKLIIIIVIRNC